MVAIIEGAVVVLKIIWAIISFFQEKSQEKKKAKGEALKEILDGVEKRDPSAITIGFARFKRV